MENLSEMDDDEADRLDMAAGLTLRSRLGCQCVVQGDIEVEIPSWNRQLRQRGRRVHESRGRDSGRETISFKKRYLLGSDFLV